MSSKKKLGIWGMGVVGKALVNYCKSHTIPYITYDQKNNSEAHKTDSLENLFKNASTIIPSPGININSLDKTKLEKITPEIDYFFSLWKKPIICITGTLGKTSITKLLTQTLQEAHTNAAFGGNIGTAMFDLFKKEEKTDTAVLELSSYQLEHAQACTPDLAIITNIYPNHLDRHKTMSAYAQAKCTILHKNNLVHTSVLPHLKPEQQKKATAVFSNQKPKNYKENISYFYYDEQKNIVLEHNKKIITLCRSKDIPTYSFPENWLCITAALYIYNQEKFNQEVIEKLLKKLQKEVELPDHRMQSIGCYNGVYYINDSKATLMESTFAALNKLKASKTILLLGGLSKGVDRIPLITKLKNKAKYCVCFGAEAQKLYQACQHEQIMSAHTKNLESALQKAQQNAQPGDTIILSPGGSSFDLFENFEHRGKLFTQLVQQSNSPC